jgi:mannobiose 2-epimerase
LAHTIERRSFLGALAGPLLAQSNPLGGYVPRLEKALFENLNPFWYPRCIDREQGGYAINFNAQGEPNGRSSKMIVTQARMVWYFSRLAREGMTKPHTRAEYLSAAEHGFQFLRAKMWDARNGGYFWEVARDGKVVRDQKHLYGQSFALYALSEMYLATRRREVLDAAGELFEVVEKQAHDGEFGGYRECFEADWSETPEAKPGPMGPSRWKLMNTHLHLMEAMTSFYLASGLPMARERLLELMTIESNTVVRKDLAACADKYTRAWKRLTEGDYARVSYGHDLENVWLLMEAAAAAGVSDAPLEDLYGVNWAYCLRHGWDEANGGFYDNGKPGEAADRRQKTWWVQAEVLVSSLRMYRRTGEAVYREVFEKTWAFCERELIDWKVGEWHAEVSAEGKPRGEKAQMWKAGYHNGRALVECLKILRAT